MRQERAATEGPSHGAESVRYTDSPDNSDPYVDNRLNLQFTRDARLPDLSDKSALAERLRELHTTFTETLDGSTGQAASHDRGTTFIAASVYNLTNPQLSDPAGTGPLQYIHEPSDHAAITGDQDTDHKSTSYRRLLDHQLQQAGLGWHPTAGDRGAGAELLETPAELVSEVQDHNDIRIIDASEDRIVLPTSNLP